jgi:hypothetical protein
MSAGRRGLAVAVLLCLAGSGLTLYAASRSWTTDVTLRPPPLPPARTARSGGDLLPWLPALAVVALAGSGAVLATRALVRRLVGALLLVLGGGLASGGIYGVAAVDRGDASAIGPALCVVGGMLVAVAGALTAARGGQWPSMGPRYERPGGIRRIERPAGGAGDDRPGGTESAAGGAVRTDTPRPGADGEAGRVEAGGTTAAWEALDRGEDPTDVRPRGPRRD